MRFHKLEESIQQGIALVGMVKREHVLINIEPMRNLLSSSQKFFCGDLRSVPHMKDYTNYPRLPFPRVAFEYLGDTTGYFCIATEGDEQGGPEMAFFMRDPDRCLYLASARLDRASGIVRGIYPNDAGPEDRDDIEKIVMTHFKGIGDFLSVLNCVNIKVETVEPPAALNKKRERTGKPPIYSYKTLVLRPSAAQRSDGRGTHESPRIHLRRGHIKHRKTGDFWWQPCVVGDRKRGVVMKDYKADALLSAQQPQGE